MKSLGQIGRDAYNRSTGDAGLSWEEAARAIQDAIEERRFENLIDISGDDTLKSLPIAEEWIPDDEVQADPFELSDDALILWAVGKSDRALSE